MNRKQFTLLFVVLIVLGGAAWFVLRGRHTVATAGEAGTGGKLLGADFPVNDVAHVSIKEGTNTLDLEKKDDLWRVRQRNDYPANFSTISDLLLKLADLKVVQIEDIGASQLARMQLAPGAGTNSGVILDLKGKDDKSIKTVTLGKRHFRKAKAQQPQEFGDEGFPDGRYVQLAGDTKHVLLIGDALGSAEAKPESWLNKDFFKVERPKTISVAFPVATNSWKLARDTETGDWKLADAKGDEKLDNAKASGVSNPFSAPTFDDVVSTNAKPSDYGLDKPMVVTVETFDDFTYTVNVGVKTGENYPIHMTVTANFPKERAPAKDEKPDEKDKADKAWKDLKFKSSALWQYALELATKGFF